MTPQAPSLRLLTPLASLVLAVAAAGWVGVVMLARGMGSMPGIMGLGIGSFIAVWALMMAAMMMLPSVTPFASLYTRTFGDDRCWRLAGFASWYLIAWIAAALPAYGLAWLAGRLAGVHPATATVLVVASFAACGGYELTHLKDRCLARCRSPLGFVLKLGAGSVLVEKTRGWGPRFSRLLGVAALGLALAVIFVPGLALGLHQAPGPGGMGGM